MHPRFDEWVAFLEGTLEEPERAAIEAHRARGCEQCARKEAETRSLLQALNDDRLLTPSPAALRAALDAHRAAPASAALPGWAASLKETLATLVFDSFAQPQAAFAGARSASVARRLCYQTDGVELDVLVEREGDVRRLTGQMLTLGEPPRPLVNARFVVLRGGRLDGESATNERGEFQHVLEAPGEVEIRVQRLAQLVTFRIPEPFFDTPED